MGMGEGGGWFQDEPYLSMEFRIISSLRMQAVRASFFGLPADNRRGKSQLKRLATIAPM